MSTMLIILAWCGLVLAVGVAWAHTRRSSRIRSRLSAERELQFEALAPVPGEGMSRLGRWLFVSGFRSPGTPTAFVSLTILACLAGFSLGLLISSSTILGESREALRRLPGGIGGVLDPVVRLSPWLLAMLVGCVPLMVVRARRRRRVAEIEEDLPMSLQLLATLSRAGLGLDAALLRVLDASDETRTLPQELMTFRRENMAGLTRADCWRRLSRRADVTSLSIFASAMIHAEQVGGGVSEVLEHQTEDVLSRRREQALITAQSLPVKLVFPLVICFLPGIFIWTLGPAFYQFVRLIDGVLRGAS